MTAVGSSVCVFAPSPLLTVTIEVGTGAGPEVHVHAGGQGLWIANMLGVLKTKALICAPIGGEIGTVLAGLLDREWFDLRRVSLSGVNGCYVEDRRSGALERIAEMPAVRLNRHETDDLCNMTLTAAAEAGVTVLTGPAGTPVIDSERYRLLAADLSNLGVTVIADLSGDALHAALDGGVDVLKISVEETGEGDPVRAAARYRERVRQAVVLTRAHEPALIFTDKLSALHVPSLATVDHRGAGDSMTAGIAAALARGDPFDKALRLGAASGAVNATRHGLASGRLDTIETIAEQVRLDSATHEEIRSARAHHQ